MAIQEITADLVVIRINLATSEALVEHSKRFGSLTWHRGVWMFGVVTTSHRCEYENCRRNYEEEQHHHQETTAWSVEEVVHAVGLLSVLIHVLLVLRYWWHLCTLPFTIHFTAMELLSSSRVLRNTATILKRFFDLVRSNHVSRRTMV